MISYQIYKIVHLSGVLMVFLALGGVVVHVGNGGVKAHGWRKPIAITHGIGMTLALIGGFGLLARLGIVHGGLPMWAYAKLIIWFVFGALLSVVYWRPTLAKFIWPVIILLGGVAAYVAGYKPG